MRETLYIRLQSAQPEAPTSFCVAGAQSLHSWNIEVAPLSDVLLRAGDKRIVVLVPANDVRLTKVSVPARSAAKVLQAAPYALEDQLAEDVDSLHFALGPRLADDSHAIAIAARATMDAWLAPFTQARLRVEALIPETLCLPAAEPGRWSALAEPGHVTVRTGVYSGFGCAEDDLPLLLQLADPERKSLLRIAVPRDHSPDFTRLEWPVELLPGHTSALEALLHHFDPAQSINLLQGSYSQTESARRMWQPWLPAAALAACWLLVAGLSHGVQAYTLGRELDRQEQSNAQRYVQLFPSERATAYLSQQLDQQAAALKSGTQGGGFLKLSEVLARSLGAAPGLTLQGLQYRDNTLYASLTGSDLQQSELLKNWYAQNGGAHLEVQSENAGTEGVQIRIKLTAA